MIAKFAGVHIIFNFTVEDEEGDVSPVSTQNQVITAKEWRTNWETAASKAFKQEALAQLEAADPEPALSSNGTRKKTVKK